MLINTFLKVDWKNLNLHSFDDKITPGREGHCTYYSFQIILKTEASSLSDSVDQKHV